MQFSPLRFFLAISLACSSFSFADDFVIDAATTEQNGGNVVNGDDTLTVTPQGSVTVDAIDALLATGNNNTFDNQGALTTTGNSASGISIENNSIVTNSGTISTAGISSQGIVMDNNNTVTNSGSITTTGVDSVGLVGVNNNIASNTGAINTEGQGSDGFFFAANNTLSNSGNVTTLGVFANGVRFDGNNNNFTNTGSICTFGENASGVLSTSNNVITNSCKIVSAQAASIELFATGNTLNLLPGSFLGGVIDLGVLNTVNITTGPSHSVLWDFSTGNLTGGLLNIDGPVPYFYDVANQKFATYDPTALAASPDLLIDVSAGAFYAIESRLFRIRESCCDCLTITPWVDLYGSRFKYGTNAEILPYRINYWNVMGGVDMCFPCDLVVGVVFGYGQGYLDADSNCYKSYENETEGFIGGAYARKLWNCFFVDLSLCGGNLCHSDKRFINDNLAPLGEGIPAKADYDSWWISPEAVVGMNIGWWYNITFIPNVRYRYAYQSINSFNEKDAEENAAVTSRDIHVDEFKAELLISKQISMVDFCIKGGFLMRNVLCESNAQVTLLEETKTFRSFSDDHYCGYVGGCVAVCFMPCLQATVEGEYISGHRMRGGRGAVSLAFTF